MPSEGAAHPAQRTSSVSVLELNIAIVSSIREVALVDEARACLTFGLNIETLQRLVAMTPPQVARFVTSLGEEALFAPRANIDKLLSAPPTVVALLAATSTRDPASPPWDTRLS